MLVKSTPTSLHTLETREQYEINREHFRNYMSRGKENNQQLFVTNVNGNLVEFFLGNLQYTTLIRPNNPAKWQDTWYKCNNNKMFASPPHMSLETVGLRSL